MAEPLLQQGDIIALQQEFEIVTLRNQTDDYWLFEGIDTQLKKRVMIQVFNTNHFNSLEEAKEAYSEKLLALEQEEDLPDKKRKYVDAGPIVVADKKYYVIVFTIISQTDEIQIKDSIKMDAIKEDLPSALPGSAATETAGAEPMEFLEQFEEEKVSLTDDIVKKKEKKVVVKVPTTEKKGSMPERPTPPKPKKPTSGRERRRSRVKPAKMIPQPAAPQEEKKDYLKHISIEFFDRMNPMNYYPFVINIADIKQEKIATVINPITGERKVQDQSEMKTKLANPIVTIKPTIPGCLVVPEQIETDFTEEEDEVTFYVTPEVKGKIIGHIKFYNEGKAIHHINLQAKVVDPNFARVVAFYGILASFAPKILTLLGINLGLTAIAIQNYILGEVSIASLIAVVGIFPAIIISLFVRQRLKPRSCKTHFKLLDFRFQK